MATKSITNSDNNFWQKLKADLSRRGGIFVLAPMADVTDCAFRKIIAKYGKPDVFWTEFVSADGLAHPVAREKLMIDLRFDKDEHPIVAQIFGSRPENIKSAAKLCAELGFDGIDINMGCPDRSIEKQCSGAAMIKNPEIARAVIRAAKEGAPNLPISVKTRLGYSKLEEMENWVRTLLSEDIAVLTVHLRTRKEMSKVPAHWELMQRIIAIRDEMGVDTLIFGNGDVKNLEEAKQKVQETGCDGVMLGRAIFGNPWLFSGGIPKKTSLKKHENFLLKIFSVWRRRASQGFSQELSLEIKKRLTVMVEHTKLFEEMLGGIKSFAIMKKHYKAYVDGFPEAKELRMKLMDAKDATEVEVITSDFLAKL